MNKLLKGAIAGAAGVALLLGGAGTFALWNANTTVGAGTIVAGELTVTPGTGVWKSLRGANAGTTITDITAYKVVPGEVLTYTQPLTVTAVGNNLTAAVTIDKTSIKPTAIGANTNASTALAAAISRDATVALGSGPAAETQTISASTTAQTITVVSTLTFPAGAAGDNSTQKGSVNLANFGVNVTQVALTTPAS